ncbi:hypothetical protein Fmac_033020 [Flemingia macrophylla]|uniref:Uncharacterized protein n=1 Tax=Flemingia macrophylla TaxID=520843 RepID=A0ABD1L6K8_9FABA
MGESTFSCEPTTNVFHGFNPVFTFSCPHSSETLSTPPRPRFHSFLPRFSWHGRIKFVDHASSTCTGFRVNDRCYLVDPASSHMLVSKIKPCMCKYELIQTVKLWTTAKEFSKDVFINQERKLGARRQSDTVIVLTIKDADQGSADVAFRTPLVPYEKSKSLGSGGSMVARMKLKGIDGMASPGVELAT